MSTKPDKTEQISQASGDSLSQRDTLASGDNVLTPAMAAKVEALAQKWQDFHDDGKRVCLEEVCASEPALIPAVREYLSKVGRLEAVLATQAPSSDTVRSSYVSGDSVLAPPQQPDELGRLGGYRVLKLIGQGGMGKVYLAEDVQLKRRVALKILLKSGDQRFMREAQTLAKVEHDHIVTVYQIGEDRGTQYLAMQYLQGETLEKRMRTQSRLTLGESIRFTRQIAQGLWAAHQQGVTHRDIKPSNIWLEAGSDRVKILDFGLARTQDAEMMLTQEGAVVGTPAFMAPEQAAGEKVDHRADLFSLGCCLYQMISGVSPFARKDVLSTLRALELETPEDPAVKAPDTPGPLSDLAMKLLAKKPADRPASAKDVLDKLDAIDATMTSTTREIPVSSVDRPRAKTGVLWMGGLAALATAAAVAAVLFWPPKLSDKEDPDKNGPLAKVDPSKSSEVKKAAPSVLPDAKDKKVNFHPDLPPAVTELPTVSLPELKDRKDFGLKVVLPEVDEDGAGVRRPREGQPFTFTIEADEDSYVGIWYQTDDGSVRQLFPNKFETSNLFKKGEARTVPGKGSNYSLVATPSQKMEMFRIIASTRPWSFDASKAEDGYQTFQGTKDFEEGLRGVVLVPTAQATQKISQVSMPVWVTPKK